MEFLNRLSQKSPISNFTAIRAVGAALIYIDGETDRVKLLGDVCDYANAPKIVPQIEVCIFSTGVR